MAKTKVRFTRESLLMGRLLDPGWYPMKVKQINEKPAKDGSTNFMVKLENTKEGDDQGVVVTRVFNEKPEAIGFMRPYLEAFGVNVEADVDFDIYQTEGEMLEVYIQHRVTDQQQTVNDAIYFRPIGSGEAEAAQA